MTNKIMEQSLSRVKLFVYILYIRGRKSIQTSECPPFVSPMDLIFGQLESTRIFLDIQLS